VTSLSRRLTSLPKRLVLATAVSIALAHFLTVLAAPAVPAPEALVERLDRIASDAWERRREPGQNLGEVINVTEVVEPYLPIGTPVESAIEFLQRAGFRVAKANPLPERKVDFKLRYVATRVPWVAYKIVAYFEYSVVIDIEDGRVSRQFSRIVFRVFP
jgi:hypothetical protein